MKQHRQMNLGCNFAQCIGHCSNRRRINRDNLLTARAYQSLSPDEQDRADRGLYGTEQPIEETPNFVQSKLADFDEELNRFSHERKKYYNLAMDIERKLRQVGDEEYVGSAKFRLMFLRGELFDVQKAARRFTRYFQEKYELFGEEKLARRIKQVDLNEEERTLLHSGAFTFVGTTDFAGRPLVMLRRNIFFTFDPSALHRTIFYVHHKLLEENEMAQRKGIVLIAYNMGEILPAKPSFLRVSLFPLMKMQLYAMPTRLAALHSFYSDLKEHFIVNLAYVVFPKTIRARVLTHYSLTHEACFVTLMSYGIDPDSLPLTAEGEIRYGMIHEYWENQKQLEQRSD